MILTTSFKKIAGLRHKNKIIQGSQGASKTFSILQRWILLAARSKEYQHCTIVTDTFPNLRTGAIKDFETICNSESFDVRQTKTPYKFKIGLWTFEFFSVDKESKGLGGRRDRLFINEGNRLGWKVARQLIGRTHREFITDFNPAIKFWAHTEFVEPGDCDFLKLTYKDNEQLPQSEIDFIERYAPWGKTPDANFWRVYGLGEIGFVEGQIFKGYETYKTLPKGEYQHAIGVDFGWEDPLTFVKVYVDHKAQKIFWSEMFYGSNAKYEDVIPQIKAHPEYEGDYMACDHYPRDILTFRRNGFKAIEANKANGVTADIRTIKQYKLYVNEKSVNLIRELDSYKYQVKNDQIIDYPATGQSDHAIDAAKYGTTFIIRK